MVDNRGEKTRIAWLDKLQQYKHDKIKPADDQIWSPSLETISRDEIVSIQNDKLKTVTPFLYENSKFYRERFDKLNLLPTDIQTIEDGLAKVEQLRGVTYIRNDNVEGGQQVGVIAQEVEKILPQVVLTADDDMKTKSVDYGRLTGVLIEAVKELSARVKELENN